MRIQKLLLALFTAALLLAGCSPDPVAKLKEHIGEVSHGRTKIFNTVWKNISYNVEKTNSLVSPYTATLSAEVLGFDDESASKPQSQTKYNMVLAFQDGDWVLKEVKSAVTYAEVDYTIIAPPPQKTLSESDTDWDFVKNQLRLK